MIPTRQTTTPVPQVMTPQPWRRRPGTASLVLGAVAVALFGCPWLPSSVSPWIRFFPVYAIVPAGVCAIVSGVGVLRDMRGDETADRRPAWAGVTLGAVAVLVPAVLVVWAWSVL
ncbi:MULTISPECIES: hypothetical protein [unclassified Streptomyces]|uniref:hypothetical protein n=1 Tax=unclassified Streptomyces TaxID=2593676 RepID=UPI0033321210